MYIEKSAVQYTREQAIEFVVQALRNLGITQEIEVLDFDEELKEIFAEDIAKGEVLQFVDVAVGPVKAFFFVPSDLQVRADYFDTFEVDAPEDITLEGMLQTIFLYQLYEYAEEVLKAANTIVEFNNAYTEVVLPESAGEEEFQTILNLIVDKMIGKGKWFTPSLDWGDLGKL